MAAGCDVWLWVGGVQKLLSQTGELPRLRYSLTMAIVSSTSRGAISPTPRLEMLPRLERLPDSLRSVLLPARSGETAAEAAAVAAAVAVDDPGAEPSEAPMKRQMFG